MLILIKHPTNPTDAFLRGEAKGILPSALSSREQREEFSQALREMSVFSARTTNARYLQTVRKVVNEIAQGDMDMGEARVVLMQMLDALGYTPEGGFPDSDVPVPPAVEGSLQDLRSFRRLDLILRTQLELLHGAGQKMRGEEPAAMRLFPAWELVRVIDREVPRDWEARFREALEELGVDESIFGKTGRLIAVKGDPVWMELGSLFDDSLDVDHPPFAFNSGKRWRAVPRAELDALLGDHDIEAFEVDGEPQTVEKIIKTLPTPKVSIKDLDDDFLTELKKIRGVKESKGGRLTVKSAMERARERRRKTEAALERSSQ